MEAVGRSVSKKKIVLATYGSYGDLYPFLAVARQLRASGHEVTIASWPNYRKDVEREGIVFHGLFPERGLQALDADGKRRMTGLSFGSLAFLRQTIFPYLEENYLSLLDLCWQGCDLIVTHTGVFAAPIAAEKLEIPWVSVYLQPLALSARVDPPLLPSIQAREETGMIGPETRARIFEEIKQGSLAFMQPVEELREKAGLARSGRNPLFEAASPFGNMAWFSRALASECPDWPANTVITGFPTYEGPAVNTNSDPGLDSFLAEGAPEFVFTLGDSARLDRGNFFEESVAIARELKARSVIVTGAADHAALDRSPDIYVAGYVRYAEIFSRANVVIHHGGMGTIGIALRYGKPMVLVPFAHDQPDNAHRVARQGTARVVQRAMYRREIMVPLLKAMREDGEMRRNAERLSAIVNAEDGVSNACRFIDLIARGFVRT